MSVTFTDRALRLAVRSSTLSFTPRGRKTCGASICSAGLFVGRAGFCFGRRAGSFVGGGRAVRDEHQRRQDNAHLLLHRRGADVDRACGAGGSNCGNGGGGGGGGFFGGGGGGAAECGNGGGGGGGSAHGPLGAVLAAAVNSGAGSVVIVYSTPLPAASASAPTFPWLPVAGLVIGVGLVWFGLRRRRAPAA